jgi:hypothetical protein
LPQPLIRLNTCFGTLQHDLSAKGTLTTVPAATSRSHNCCALAIISTSITILPEQYVEELKSVDDSLANNASLFKTIVSELRLVQRVTKSGVSPGHQRSPNAQIQP